MIKEERKSCAEEIDKELEALAERLSKIKGNDCEVYSRVTGYYRPLSKWNPGKKEEYKERVDYEQERN